MKNLILIIAVALVSCKAIHLRSYSTHVKARKEKWIKSLPYYSKEFKKDIASKIAIYDTVIFAKYGVGFHFLAWKEKNQWKHKEYHTYMDTINNLTARCLSCPNTINSDKLNTLYQFSDTSLLDVVRTDIHINHNTDMSFYNVDPPYIHISFHFRNWIHTLDFRKDDLEELTCEGIPQIKFKIMILDILEESRTYH